VAPYQPEPRQATSGYGDNSLASEWSLVQPLVRLRDAVPGSAVSLVKAGVTLEGLPVGSVRPPQVDPTSEHVEQLAAIIAAGRAAAAVLTGEVSPGSSSVAPKCRVRGGRP
jgi:5-dehydro-4-deoxyglucarate dehydratase